MDATIGTLQKSVAYTTLNNQNPQQQPIARFLSAPIAAQTIAAQFIQFDAAVQQSNTNSSFQANAVVLAVWRPGTGALVGTLFDSLIGAPLIASSTTETAPGVQTLAPTSTSVVAADNDILVVELWRNDNAQGMNAAYTNTVYYDGTTEDSATTNAAYILFTNDVALFVANAIPPGLGPIVGMPMSMMMPIGW
jgi:hypothetical protein